MSGTWALTSNLNTARASHTATLLENGTVLAVGGQGGPVTSAELYDSTSDTWTVIGNLNIERSAHTANLLRDGELFIAGGYGEDTPAQPSGADSPDFVDHKSLSSAELSTYLPE